MTYTDIYKSVLKNLSFLPLEYLPKVDQYLSNLKKEIRDKETNKVAIMALAGSWSDMSKEDFSDYLDHARNTGKQLFNRDIEL
jgi:chromosome segregation and condensation protein ScpB